MTNSTDTYMYLYFFTAVQLALRETADIVVYSGKLPDAIVNTSSGNILIQSLKEAFYVFQEGIVLCQQIEPPAVDAPLGFYVELVMHNGDYFVFQCKTEEAMDALIDAAHRDMTPQTAAELEENRKENKKSGCLTIILMILSAILFG